MTATIFDSVGCVNATKFDKPWPELVSMLEHPATSHSKKGRLIKLATFGNKRKPNPEQSDPNQWSLKHDGNVLEITGIEGDYDAGLVSVEEANDRLENAGIRATVYTSWGHGLVKPPKYNGGPRWRVLAPLSKPYPPSQRTMLLERLNGALGGILADESFALSQGYYFSKRPDADYKCISTFDDPTDGTCIDELPDLDFVAFGKRSKPEPSNPGKHSGPIGAEMFEAAVAREGRLLVSGDSRREMLKSYIASRSARGLPADDIRLLIDGIAARYFDPCDPIDEDNIAKIVKDFARKDANRHDDEFKYIDPQTGEVHIKPRLTSVSVCDVLTNPAKPPQFVWDGYLPRGNVALLGAHGGTGKSTLALMLAVCTVLGNPLFGVDTERCKVLFVSLEDGTGVVRHRLAQICQAWFIEPADLDGVLQIVDGTDYPELFAAETRGAGELTRTYDELHALVKAEGFGLVVVDNASDAFGGDEIQRRQVRAFMRALAQIARLTDCAVVLLAHVDKATSRARKAEGGEGYSGSTAWHNSARSRLFLTRAESGALTLEHQKSNLGKLREPLSLDWPNGGLPMLAPSYSGLTERMQGRADDERATQLLKLIAEFESRGQFCSPAITSRNHVYAVLKSEPEFQRLKLGSDATKRIVNQCQRAKWIEPLDYRTPDRKPHHRWTLTTLGRTFAGLPAPTAPTAPTPEDGASQSMAQASAPAAPTGVGGVGERAHTQDGAETGQT
jgi:hypothetical protein